MTASTSKTTESNHSKNLKHRCHPAVNFILLQVAILHSQGKKQLITDLRSKARVFGARKNAFSLSTRARFFVSKSARFMPHKVDVLESGNACNF